MSDARDLVDACIYLLKSSPTQGAMYLPTISGFTRWADFAKASDLPKVRLLTSLILAVSLSGESTLLDSKEFARNPALWGKIIAKAEIVARTMDPVVDHFLDPLRVAAIGDGSFRIPEDDEVEPPPPQDIPPGGKSANPTDPSPQDQSAIVQALVESISKSLPDLIDKAILAKYGTSPSLNPLPPSQIQNPLQPSQIPSPANLANDPIISNKANDLMNSVQSMISTLGPNSGRNPDLNPRDPQNHSLNSQTQHFQAPPPSVPQPIQNFYYYNGAEDESPLSGSLPLASRMPISVPVTTKKKNSFWAPRLMTDEAKSKSGKDLHDIPFPMMSDYFELSMRVCDLLDLKDDHFVDYVGYSRWIMALRNNHSWDSVMHYDEAFRTEMELHRDFKWDRRPQDLERLHLVSRHIRDNDSNTYSGAKRKSASHPAGETCRNFNSDRCNRGTSCTRVHRCSHCEKPGHPASKCPDKAAPNAQPGQASSQGKPGANRD
jgi:hypothetical protein